MFESVAVSFEFFPPAMKSPWGGSCGVVQRLAPFAAEFRVGDLTGADGSTRTRTHDCVLRICARPISPRAS